MIEEAYCSYEISKLLKEKGFDSPCQAIWCGDRIVLLTHLIDNNSLLFTDEYKFSIQKESLITIPTHQMANAWLREKHGLHASACILKDSSNDADGNEVDRWTYWSYDIMSVYDGTFIYQEYEKIDDEQYQSHDAAIEAALKYALENLI